MRERNKEKAVHSENRLKEKGRKNKYIERREKRAGK
jgi:hypothetical protein